MLKIIIVIYSSLMIFLHRRVNEIVDILYKRYSFESIDRFLFYLLFGIIILTLGLFIIRHLRDKLSIVAPAVLIIIFPIPLMYIFLFVSSVEAVHFFQYAILAIMLIMIFKNIIAVFSISVVLGVIDELYQYFVLYAGDLDAYMDFNDMFLNVHGALIGIIISLIVRNPS